MKVMRDILASIWPQTPPILFRVNIFMTAGKIPELLDHLFWEKSKDLRRESKIRIFSYTYFDEKV